MSEIELHDGSTMQIVTQDTRNRRLRESLRHDAPMEPAKPKIPTLPATIFQNRAPSGEEISIEADQIDGVGVIRFRKSRGGVVLDEFCFEADHLPFLAARRWHEHVIKGAWRVGFLPDHMVIGEM